MSPFVESLKRLYDDKKISEAKVVSLYKEEKISFIEKEYILSK